MIENEGRRRQKAARPRKDWIEAKAIKRVGDSPEEEAARALRSPERASQECP